MALYFAKGGSSRAVSSSPRLTHRREWCRAPMAFSRTGTDMQASVFIASSIDGFIARTNGALDWLPAGGGEEHGYDEFMSTVDALVIGRKTFETVLGFDSWPYGDKPVVVLSSRPSEVRPPA